MNWLTDQVPDDEDSLLPTEEEAKAVAGAQQARAEGRSTDQRRSSADEVLDAVAGVDTTPRRSSTKCPLCGSPTKVRGMTAMMTTLTRRCTNRACKNEFPVASVKSRTAMPPMFPDPMIHGGPYPIGPNRGGSSAPPIDPNQPINRRLSEFQRRIRNDGE